MQHTTPPTTDSRFAMPISETIWDMKYRFKDPDITKPDGTVVPGVIHDVTVEDTWRRVAEALAEAESEDTRAYWAEEFYKALDGFQYLPAGRITAGAGTGRRVTLFNCFVMGTIPDSMDGIFDMLKEAALTMQQGGGIGYDFSTIRPKGTLVKGVGSDASGPLSFMDVWDSMCKTIMSAGSRRGAMMATMRCDHPDIEDFITAKRDPARLRNFNVSVLATDAFMEAVKADTDWDLVWEGEVMKTVRARELWDLIMESTYNYAEPGVIFIDRINQRNPLAYIEEIAATNPCGEQPLPPYGACLLGSINLAMLIADPFEATARMDDDRMERLVARAVRMMDNVVDVSGFALEAQEKEAKAKRRIGLGVTGLADALMMLRLAYGTEEAAQQVESWMRKIQHAAYRASVALAKEKGPFPLFEADGYLASPTIQDLDPDLREEIRTHGIRNALLTSIAPTGTISLYASNVSSGIEPVFAFSYERKVTQKDGSRTTDVVTDYAVKTYKEKYGITDDADLPDWFVSAMTLAPLQHVRMQAAAQKWVDSSISKTINCPVDISFEAFKDVYLEAYETGCKGCTTFRPNDVTGSMLSVDTPKEDTPTEVAESSAPAVSDSAPMPRPETLQGQTFKLKWPMAAHPFYITINDMVDETGQRRPFEVFINTQNVESFAWITALTRMISAVFRRGGDISFVAKELREVFDPQGGAWMGGRYVDSLIAAIGGILYDHMVAIGYLEESQRPDGAVVPAQADVAAHAAPPSAKICTSCGERAVIQEAGCAKCTACGDSSCG